LRLRLDGGRGAGFQLGEALASSVSSLTRLRRSLDAFLEFVVGHAIGGVHSLEGGLVDDDSVDCQALGVFGSSLRGKSPWVDSSSARNCGEMVSRSQPRARDFTEVAEAGAHDDGL